MSPRTNQLLQMIMSNNSSFVFLYINISFYPAFPRFIQILNKDSNTTNRLVLLDPDGALFGFLYIPVTEAMSQLWRKPLAFKTIKFTMFRVSLALFWIQMSRYECGIIFKQDRRNHPCALQMFQNQTLLMIKQAAHRRIAANTPLQFPYKLPFPQNIKSLAVC